MKSYIKQLTLACLSAAVLAACGGGGSGSSDTAPKVSVTAITGNFSDANKNPIASATLTVELDGYQGDRAFKAVTDQNGDWSLDFGALSGLPDRVAGVFQKEGYVPKFIQLAAKDGRIISQKYAGEAYGTRLKEESDFEFTDGNSIFHLGDSGFTGASNSQLQVGTSGLIKSLNPLNVTERQLYGYDELCIDFIGRGIDANDGYPSYLSIPTHNLQSFLGQSPSDGSFGSQRHCFKTKDLKGVPGMRIYSAQRGSDYDDFEIVNVTGKLVGKNNSTKILATLGIRTPDQTKPRVIIVSINSIGFFPIGTVKVVWNFGDGSATVTEAVKPEDADKYARSASPPEITHTFPRAGSYTVRASFQDAAGKELGFSAYTVTVR